MSRPETVTKQMMGPWTRIHRGRSTDPAYQALPRTAKQVLSQLEHDPKITRIGVIRTDASTLASQHTSEDQQLLTQEIEVDLRALEESGWIHRCGIEVFLTQHFLENHTEMRTPNALKGMASEIRYLTPDMRDVVVRRLFREIDEMVERDRQPLTLGSSAVVTAIASENGQELPRRLKLSPIA